MKLNMRTNVSIFFKKTMQEVEKMKFTELKKNYITVLYNNKKMKEMIPNA